MTFTSSAVMIFANLALASALILQDSERAQKYASAAMTNESKALWNGRAAKFMEQIDLLKTGNAPTRDTKRAVHPDKINQDPRLDEETKSAVTELSQKINDGATDLKLLAQRFKTTNGVLKIDKVRESMVNTQTTKVVDRVAYYQFSLSESDRPTRFLRFSEIRKLFQRVKRQNKGKKAPKFLSRFSWKFWNRGFTKRSANVGVIEERKKTLPSAIKFILENANEADLQSLF